MPIHAVRTILAAAFIMAVLPPSLVHAMGRSGVQPKSDTSASPAYTNQSARGSIARVSTRATPAEVADLRRQIADLQMQLASVKERVPAE
jgi:hypothetical protein